MKVKTDPSGKPHLNAQSAWSDGVGEGQGLPFALSVPLIPTSFSPSPYID